MADTEVPFIKDSAEVKEFVKSLGFNATELASFVDSEDQYYLLAGNTWDDLKDFMKENGLKTVFYEFEYLDELELYMDDPADMDDTWDDIDKDFAEAFSKRIAEWNDRIDEYDFTDPAFLYAFTFFEGKAFGICVPNLEYGEYLDDPEDIYVDLLIGTAEAREESE